MNVSSQNRRHVLARLVRTASAAAIGTLLPLQSEALERPLGGIILNVDGRLEVRNTPSGAAFDLALIDALPQHHFSTRAPWYPRARKFSGVLVSDLLKALGSQAVNVRATALNDYRVDIPVDTMTQYGALLATRLDDMTISVRDKGPLLIMYPFDNEPDTRTAIHYVQAIWQLRRLELR